MKESPWRSEPPSDSKTRFGFVFWPNKREPTKELVYFSNNFWLVWCEDSSRENLGWKEIPKDANVLWADIEDPKHPNDYE